MAELNERMTTLLQQMDTMQKTMKLMQTEFKKVNKEITKLNKKKRSKAQVDENGERIVQKTGFALPVGLSPQLCEFLSVPVGTLLSRTDVTRQINAYIKEHSLQNPQNGRQIIPDEKLTNLLQPGGADLSYFTLQKFMKHHFLKKDATQATTSTEPTPEKPTPTVAVAKKATTPRGGKAKKPTVVSS